jgi:hypothetical protein
MSDGVCDPSVLLFCVIVQLEKMKGHTQTLYGTPHMSCSQTGVYHLSDYLWLLAIYTSGDWGS